MSKQEAEILGILCKAGEAWSPATHWLETTCLPGLELTGLGSWGLPTAIFGVGARPPRPHPRP